MARLGSASRGGFSRRKFLAGGLALGGGVAGLHLLGLSAVPSPALAQSAGAPKRGGTLVAAQEVDPGTCK